MSGHNSTEGGGGSLTELMLIIGIIGVVGILLIFGGVIK